MYMFKYLIDYMVVLIGKYGGIYYGKLVGFSKIKKIHRKTIYLELEDVWFFTDRYVRKYGTASVPKSTVRQIELEIPNIEKMNKQKLVQYINENTRSNIAG